ncbi:Guanylate cyclase activator 2B, partial [Lemmus lemmus]
LQYNGFQVQLESVKKLSELEKEQASNPQLKTSSLLPDVCHDPALPVDLQPVCASQEAASIFKALSKHTAPPTLPSSGSSMCILPHISTINYFC